MPYPFLTSLARNAPFRRRALESAPLSRGDWRTGDYVVGRVLSGFAGIGFEEPSGRMVEAMEGDRVVGALGKRYATLETTGDWEKVGEDGVMQALTAAGVLGRVTSHSRSLPPLVDLLYEGHVHWDGKPARMADFALPILDEVLEAPVILLIGTSMSAGKTASAKTIVRALKARGLRVGGTKLTGVGRYRDVLAMADAGADTILDFVDAGLPSTLCDRAVFEPALDAVTSNLARARVDVVVAEAGASPLEPYNGDTVVARLGDSVALTVLCASDPYAVVGVTEAFGVKPDLVAGLCTSTRAGIELVERLSQARALNLIDTASLPELDELLEAALPRPLT
jgi:hypothetical protein